MTQILKDVLKDVLKRGFLDCLTHLVDELDRARIPALRNITEGFSHFVTSMTAPVASGWSGIPAILPDRPFVDAGGLMSYGGSLADAARIAGLYVGRILKMLWGGSGENISIAALSKPMDPVMTKPKVKTVNDLAGVSTRWI
jgi:hypothetical protein